MEPRFGPWRASTWSFQAALVAALVAAVVHATSPPPPLPARLAPRPHILLILIDDWGHSDIGYTNRLVDNKIRTPHLDNLSAVDGSVQLHNYYVQHICTPTRSVLLSGRYQIHTGLQHGVIETEQPNSLPLDIPLISDHMQQLGYTTHLAGKWHVGFYHKDACPWNRGFNTTMGYLTGSEDYKTHANSGAYDFRSGAKVDKAAVGTYSTDLIRDAAIKIITQHGHGQNQSSLQSPLFLYIPFQAVHAPLQAKKGWKNKVNRSAFPKGKAGDNRFVYAAMVLEMDAAVGAIANALKSARMYNNSVILVSSDNGGEPKNGGYNWPYRGHKAGLWEGGVKAVGFLHSPLLFGAAGRAYTGLLHVSDWLPTFVNLAGGDASVIQGLDGVDVWPAIISGGASPRTELLHNIDMYGGSGPGGFGNAAIRVGELKLLSMGYRATVSSWYVPPGCPPSVCVAPPPPAAGTCLAEANNTARLWLFNLTADPYERCNLAGQTRYASAVCSIMEKLAQYNDTAVPVRYPKDDPAAKPKTPAGSWGPWRQ